MKCPVDATDLIMTERSEAEIDYCPQCRGVWLDRGELDKIIDRAAGSQARSSTDRDNYRDDNRGREHHGRNGRRRREGFLGDLFDF